MTIRLTNMKSEIIENDWLAEHIVHWQSATEVLRVALLDFENEFSQFLKENCPSHKFFFREKLFEENLPTINLGIAFYSIEEFMAFKLRW